MRIMLKTTAIIGLVLTTSNCRRLAPSFEEDSSSTSSIGPDFGSKYSSQANAAMVRENLDAASASKKTAMVYYFVDTAEPYMQGAVAHELRALREACLTRNKNVNWVAFVNSYYLPAHKFLTCQSGAYSVSDVDPAVVAEIDAKSQIFVDPRYDMRDVKNIPEAQRSLFNPNLLVSNLPALNVGYAKLPLAHPEVLRALMHFAFTKVFPSDQYVHFVTTKSHGGAGYAVAGLTEAQTAEKAAKQIEKLKAKSNNFYEELKYGTVDFRIPLRLDAKITKYGLGQLVSRRTAYQNYLKSLSKVDKAQIINNTIDGLGPDGLGPDGLGPDGLGPDGLGADGLGPDGLGPDGLGADGLGPDGLGPDGLGADGLGADGLEADALFGTTVLKYIEAMRLAMEGAPAPVTLGFLFIEACNTRIRTLDFEGPDAGNLNLEILKLRPSLKAIYSGNGNLQYRNVDWNNVYFDWLKDANPAAMQKSLIEASAKMANYRKK